MQQVAQGLASLGRGDDKMLVHMTPGEVKGLQHLAMAHGGSLTINPHTGLPEAGFLSSILPMLAAGAAVALTGGAAAPGLLGMGAGATGALAGGITGAVVNPNDRLRGAFGGALSGMSAGSLTGNLMNTGATQIGAEAAKNALDPTKFPVINDPTVAAQNVLEKASGWDRLKAGIPGSLAEAGQFAKANASNLVGMALPAVGGYLMGQPAPGVPDIAKQKAQFYNTRYRPPVYNPATGKYEGGSYDPTEISDTMRVASGGQIQAPSMPLDLSQNYPGSNITKSSYATLPSTQPQEIMDGYGPKINPFTGAEGMAGGGVVSQLMEKIDAAKAAGQFQPSPSPYTYNPDNQTYAQNGIVANYNPANNSQYSGSGVPDAATIANMGVNASGPAMVTNGMPPDLVYALQHSALGSNLRTMAAGGGIRGLKKGDAIYSNAPGAGPYSDAAEEGPYSDAAGRGMYTSTDMSKGLEAEFRKMSPGMLARYKKGAKNAAMQAAAAKEEYARASAPTDYTDTEMAAGGIASLHEYAAGGKLLRGPGDGMSDDIPAVIKGQTPQRAALADGEFVIPADVVSHLGNGSTDAGAKRLYSMMDKVRQARTGRKAQGRQIKAEKYIPA